MARKQQGAAPDHGEPRLTEPIATAEAKISERIDKGQQLSTQITPISSVEELKARKAAWYSWDEYNRTLLTRLLGKPVLDEYVASIGIYGSPSSPQAEIREFEEDLARDIRKLESIRDRLPLWADEATEAVAPSVRDERGPVAIDGPIFVVHGHNLGRANEVARVLERATGKDVVILHEQANRGRTVLEKFEQHAAQASFAVVVLTGDDEGGAKGADGLRARGRQNVIFEMGFFFALLGRDRVVVLLEPDVEQPSDVHGLVYERLDSGGSWKQGLARELSAAGIAVDRSRIP